jgi:hypothetical protein
MYVLFYLCPWVEDSVSTADTIQVRDHKHFTSSTSIKICCIVVLVVLAPERTSI